MWACTQGSKPEGNGGPRYSRKMPKLMKVSESTHIRILYDILHVSECGLGKCFGVDNALRFVCNVCVGGGLESVY